MLSKRYESTEVDQEPVRVLKLQFIYIFSMTRLAHICFRYNVTCWYKWIQ